MKINIKTLKFRVKDKHVGVLRKMAGEVNQVWNYCNALSYRMVRERGKWMTGFDFSPYTSGSSKEFEYIGSSTIQECSEKFAHSRKIARRIKLRWRKSYGSRKSLGWVPFKSNATHLRDGKIQFAGHRFNIWDSYGLTKDVKFRAGSFSEDSKGRWFFCVAIEADTCQSEGTDVIGVDLGLKTVATCSDGTTLEGKNYRDLEPALAIAQRAGNKNRTRAIHAKIRNRRLDSQHKFSTALVSRCEAIYVGDVSPTKLIKTRMAKSVYDAGWSQLKTMLKYKSQRAGIVYEEVNEQNTTRACSKCKALSGPSGLKELGIREWKCLCGANHNRDVNAARNILAVGCGRAPLAVGNFLS